MMLKYHIRYKVVFKSVYYHPFISSSSDSFIAAYLFLKIVSSLLQPKFGLLLPNPPPLIYVKLCKNETKPVYLKCLFSFLEYSKCSIIFFWIFNYS